jgi:hypothetical protein
MLENFKKRRQRKKKIREKSNHSHANITTLDLIKRYLDSKIPKPKQKAENPNISLLPNNAEDINYIAIVLDGVVEDVIRTQNRMAALLLSEPTFVEFDPGTTYPQIGITEYKDGVFSKTAEQNNPNQENEESEEF